VSDAPFTTEERYTRAVQSSHLELRETPGDVDALIAAGWIKEGMGPMLYRLHVEFDSVKAEHGLVLRNQQRAQEAIKALAKELNIERLAMARGPTRAGLIAEQLKALEEQTERAALTERVLMLSKLRTLPRVRQEFGHWAIVQATSEKRRRAMRATGQQPMDDGSSILVLAGRVLQAHLDPLCRPCQGRGSNGGYDSPLTVCRACKGSGRSAAALGKDDSERSFCQFLLAEMEQALSEVERLMRAFLKTRVI
jgi:hypothetical protein